MVKATAPFSNIFFALGAVVIIRTYYDACAGTYYDGSELSYYTDTLQEKPAFFKESKRSDYYQFQLSYARSKFIIADNSCSIIQGDKNKLAIVNSLDTGDIVTIGYPAAAEELSNSNLNEVKAFTLAVNNQTIVSKEEVLKTDNRDKKKFYLIGLASIICGFIGLCLRKRNRHT